MADISGTNGNDVLNGTSTSDNVAGNGGDDLLHGGAGADHLDGGAGTDTADYAGDFGAIWADLATGIGRWNYAEGDTLVGIENLSGTEFGDLLFGSATSNRLAGNGGNDLLHGGAGADRLEGGAGADTADYSGDFGAIRVDLTAGIGQWNYAEGDILTGIENVVGTEYGDLLFGSAGTNRLAGNGGNDLLHGGGGGDQLEGGGGTDTADYSGDFGAIWADLAAGIGHWNFAEGDTLVGIENLAATEYADSLYGSAGINRLAGNGGDDLLHGGAGADRLEGGAGTDTAEYSGNFGAIRVDLASGTGQFNYAEGDILVGIENVAGTEFDDFLYGGAGSNRLAGNGGNDLVHGGTGADRLEGGAGNDTADYSGDFGAIRVDLATGTGNWNYAEGDTLAGIENLVGTAFGDTLIGDGSANRLSGGSGADTLTGGGGADSFVFDTPLGGGNIDSVADFESNFDSIVLAGSAGQPFAALGTGGLDIESFRVGDAAVDGTDRVIYNSQTGALLYDADGNGSGSAVQFATLATGLSLFSSHFIVTGPANGPTMITSGTTAHIAENSPTSTIVYQVVANDPDGDTIGYSVLGGDASFFTIDTTGAVRLVNPADFETRQSYSFMVQAIDSAGAGEVKWVTLNIDDVDETTGPTPIITETSGLNDSVGSAQAIDRNVLQPSTNPLLFDDDLPSAKIVGNLPTSTDRDFFSITLQAGEKLILDVDNSGGNLDAHVRVYNSSGAEIGDNDDLGTLDPGSDPHPTYGHNTDSFFSFRATTAGTYYFSIESFQDAENPTFGSYDLNVSIGPVATPEQILEEDIQALIDSNGWPDPDPNTPGVNLTYAFPNEPNDYPPNTSEVNSNFEQFNPVQRGATAQMLEHMSTFSNLVFTQLFDDQESAATLRYAMSDEAEVAYAYLPGGPLGGTAWFRNSPIDGRPTPSFDNPVPGSYSWMSILHETGHALGLKHGHEAPAVSFDRDSVEYTVMTYRSYPGQTIDGYSNETWGFPTTMMALDIAALQRLYGANFDFNPGNNVYSWSPSSGQMSVDGVGGLLPGGGNRIFMTVWDGGGNDTYDLSNYGNNIRIDLRPGEWSVTSQTQLANLGDGHFARGNILNAYQYNGDARSLIENAIGGSGDDLFFANQAGNHLTGGAGNDTFHWESNADVGVGALADFVTDFVRGADKIILTGIDADSNIPGDNAFSFIATNAFSNTARELRYEVAGGDVHIQGDVNGDGVADFEIILNNLTSLDAADFNFSF